MNRINTNWIFLRWEFGSRVAKSTLSWLQCHMCDWEDETAVKLVLKITLAD